VPTQIHADVASTRRGYLQFAASRVAGRIAIYFFFITNNNVVYALGASLHIGQRIYSAHLPMAGTKDAEKYN
jgi:hypothetical protein